jgi:hypothetical protein
LFQKQRQLNLDLLFLSKNTCFAIDGGLDLMFCNMEKIEICKVDEEKFKTANHQRH